MRYPLARTRAASAAAAPAIPFPFRTVTRTEWRGRIGRAGALWAAGAGLFAAARAFSATGLAISAVPVMTSPIRSSVATPAATTAMVRQGWPVGGLGMTCSTGSIGFAARRLDPSTTALEVAPVEVRDNDRLARRARRRERA